MGLGWGVLTVVPNVAPYLTDKGEHTAALQELLHPKTKKIYIYHFVFLAHNPHPNPHPHKHTHKTVYVKNPK